MRGWHRRLAFTEGADRRQNSSDRFTVSGKYFPLWCSTSKLCCTIRCCVKQEGLCRGGESVLWWNRKEAASPKLSVTSFLSGVFPREEQICRPFRGGASACQCIANELMFYWKVQIEYIKICLANVNKKNSVYVQKCVISPVCGGGIFSGKLPPTGGAPVSV